MQVVGGGRDVESRVTSPPRRLLPVTPAARRTTRAAGEARGPAGADPGQAGCRDTAQQLEAPEAVHLQRRRPLDDDSRDGGFVRAVVEPLPRPDAKVIWSSASVRFPCRRADRVERGRGVRHSERPRDLGTAREADGRLQRRGRSRGRRAAARGAGRLRERAQALSAGERRAHGSGVRGRRRRAAPGHPPGAGRWRRCRRGAGRPSGHPGPRPL